MKFDLDLYDFQSTQIKVPSLEEVCLFNYFENGNLLTENDDESSKTTRSKDILFCFGCKSVCSINDVLVKHVSRHKNCVLFQVKDIAIQAFASVWFLSEIAKTLNQFITR